MDQELHVGFGLFCFVAQTLYRFNGTVVIIFVRVNFARLPS